MRKRDYARLIELTKQCGPEAILRAASLCDGHSILKPQALVDAGLPADVVADLTSTYKSDGSPKGTLFLNGLAVKQLTGVYGLNALRFLAAALGVEYRDAIGRGFEAQNIRAALHQHFKSAGAPPPPA
jgi:hypothetical protein